MKPDKPNQSNPDPKKPADAKVEPVDDKTAEQVKGGVDPITSTKRGG